MLGARHLWAVVVARVRVPLAAVGVAVADVLNRPSSAVPEDRPPCRLHADQLLPNWWYRGWSWHEAVVAEGSQRVKACQVWTWIVDSKVDPQKRA